MKAITRVRRAAHLMAHVEDLQGLGEFDAQDVRVLQDALLLLIEHIQQSSAVSQIDLHLPPPFPAKIYEFHQRNHAPNNISVSEVGCPERRRRLKHVPIFSYGFGLRGLPAWDAALAILADAFEEELSMRTFAAGNGQYCLYYRAFAKELLPSGHIETRYIRAFLRRKRESEGASVS